MKKPSMAEDRPVRVAVIGVGRMGAVHARELALGHIPRATLTALCDTDPEALARFAVVASVPGFTDSRALYASGLADAVLIATPHYDHTPLAIEALAAGVHVLTEKPLAVHKADCLRMLAAYEARPKPSQIFAEMFNQRTDPRFLKLRGLIQSGELGTLRRMNWIITDWFRTEAYYRSAGWRATWRGEGGGALLNQCPHQLDLWQWLFGMPVRVHAFCGFGRFHDIEVEDQVTAYLEYENGASGVFVTTTAEAPGTNRLEVVGDLGKVVVTNSGLEVTRNQASMMDFVKNSPDRCTRPASSTVNIELPPGEGQHNAILTNFVNAILDDAPLIAPATEGIASVELSNAMIYSGLRKQTVELPLDPAEYAAALERLVQTSRYTKPQVLRSNPEDIAKVFG
ncbi:MAG: Gfo/Idh/MocA family oxidoreductase [Polyangiaceae bacterium]